MGKRRFRVQRGCSGPVLEVLVIDLKEGKTQRFRWWLGHPRGQEVIPVMVGLRRKKNWDQISSELGGRVHGREDDVDGGVSSRWGGRGSGSDAGMRRSWAIL